ncbi:MAG: DUF4434 domain-containing protein [Armatimonadetes bacterium]|nr:DUF4434 domain-containing protein [Armatimonadota bacterium]
MGAILGCSLLGLVYPCAAGDLSCSLTVVPPGPVTDKIEVEARVGLRNAGAAEQAVRVSVRCDGKPLTASTVTVPPGGSRLVQAWWPTAGQPGRHRLSYRVEQGATLIAEGQWPIRVVACDTPALPRFQAGWLDLLGLLNSVYPRGRDMTDQDLRRVVDAMHRLGMDTIIVTYVEFQGHFFYPSRVRFYDRDHQKEAGGSWVPYDAIEAILSRADRHGMHVFLGLGRSGDLMLLANGLQDPQRIASAVATSREVATELWERYQGHRSLYGWYLTHEMNDLAAASAYYDPVADFCHSLRPDMPVLVAPDGSPKTSRETLEASHVDIFAYQDAVGPGYVPYQYTYDPERRIASLEEVYADYQSRHQGSRKHLWTDLEIWEMAGPNYGNPYPAAWTRVARQLAIESRHVEMVTAYEVLGFLEAPDGALKLEGRRAADLYREYEAHRRRVRR